MEVVWKAKKNKNILNNQVRNLINSKIRFPEKGQCYDYFFDPNSHSWVLWETKVNEYSHNPEQLFQNIIVPTVNLTRLRYILRANVMKEKQVLFIGLPGTGKTTIVKNFFNHLHELKTDTHSYTSATINLNNLFFF